MANKDYTETVQTLAGMSMFVIADVTSPKSTPLEFSFHWVLTTLGYETKEDLLNDDNIKTNIIDRAVAKREELRKAKNDEPEMILIRKKVIQPIAS